MPNARSALRLFIFFFPIYSVLRRSNRSYFQAFQTMDPSSGADEDDQATKKRRRGVSELRVGTVIEGTANTVMGKEGVIVHIDETGED